MIKSFKKVLVLGAHADDGELGCGGTIARFTEAGATVYYASFSICEDSVPPEYPRDILATEIILASDELGISSENLIVHRYPVRHFPQHRQKILENMVELKHDLNPDLVIIPSQSDIHQDHQVINQEGVRAFKQVSILGYELPWNNIEFPITALISLSELQINKKLEALKKYQSQSHRSYIGGELMRHLAAVRGVQAGCDFAEAFEVVRWIVR